MSGPLGPGAQGCRYPGHGDIGMLVIRVMGTWDEGTLSARELLTQDTGTWGHKDTGTQEWNKTWGFC